MGGSGYPLSDKRKGEGRREVMVYLYCLPKPRLRGVGGGGGGQKLQKIKGGDCIDTSLRRPKVRVLCSIGSSSCHERQLSQPSGTADKSVGELCRAALCVSVT